MINNLLNRTELILKEREEIDIDTAKKVIYKFYDVFEDEILEEKGEVYKDCVNIYGQFLLYVFEGDIFGKSDLITLILEYLEICFRNFEGYEDITYIDNLKRMKDFINKKGYSNFISNAIEFYIVQFGYMSCMYLSHSILNNQENGFDTSGLINIYNTYEEDNRIFSRNDYTNAFVNFYKDLSKEEFSEYIDDIYDIVDTYIEVNEMISNIALLVSFSEIREVSSTTYQVDFIDNYILDYAPSLIKHFNEINDIQKVNELYNLISVDFKDKDEVFKGFSCKI